LAALQEIVKADSKQRYDLLFEPDPSALDSGTGAWWMRARQGHSMEVCTKGIFFV
jgi:2'-phosphotransferase